MPHTPLETENHVPETEASRLAVLLSTGILDTEPEACYDAITHLCAQYFKADTALLEFADESRVWIKSCFGHSVRELPRQNSIFDMVLAEGGPVMITDVASDPRMAGARLLAKRMPVAFGRRSSGALR